MPRKNVSSTILPSSISTTWSAHGSKPLPVSLGAETCAFRPYALAALAKWHRQWRPVSESNSLEPLIATLEADLAVAPMLTCAAPASLEILSDAAGLPRLPVCHVNLYLPRNTQNDMARELAAVLRDEFAAAAARPGRTAEKKRTRARSNQTATRSTA